MEIENIETKSEAIRNSFLSATAECIVPVVGGCI